MPFGERRFDLITSNMVVEHLDDPETQFREIREKLRPGGRFVFHTPNKLGYATLFARMMPNWLKVKLAKILEGREEDDVFPAYFRANGPKEIKRLAEHTGLEVEDLRFIVSTSAFMMIPPLAILSLFWIRLLMTSPMKHHRTNIIATLQRPQR